ncbi:hypothetical protein JTE90_015189 [Oedothorax gibbosus]|uniref:Uncharacterized protein n=1 Tax=Oedothorax gibbosus TaxID=931172 RepID=A0AAV6V775_9ARAC|nr:hypothetical protein JTE90_015189 [Oedothorax gibbosus]
MRRCKLPREGLSGSARRSTQNISAGAKKNTPLSSRHSFKTVMDGDRMQSALKDPSHQEQSDAEREKILYS